MTWGKTLKESFTILKKELSEKGVDSIEIFMNYVFQKLYEKLHEKTCIDKYEDFCDFEKELEDLIQEKIKKSIEEIKKYNEIIDKNSKDKESSISLLKEKYENKNYKEKKYPFYEKFYYSDYLDEDYIEDKILKYTDKNLCPLLDKYLVYKINNKKEDKNYSMDKLHLFNKVLYFFNDKYSHKITREFAQKQLLKDIEIYKNSDNGKLIDDFIEFYNKLQKKNKKGQIIKLEADKNYLSDFVLDGNEEIGKSYKEIYNYFIKKQNEE